MKKVFLIGVLFLTFLISQPLLLFGQATSEGEAIEVSEKTLTMMPCLYAQKNIITEGIFLDVSPSLLDDWFHDRDTRFDSREYINFRTLGNDMFYYFIKQINAGIISTLKTGDKIIISGYVRTCQDKHPWVEVDSVVKVPVE